MGKYVVGDSGSLIPIVLSLCPIGDLSASLFPNVALRNFPGRPIPPAAAGFQSRRGPNHDSILVTPHNAHNAPFSTYKAVLFCRHGHAIIALRKARQL